MTGTVVLVTSAGGAFDSRAAAAALACAGSEPDRAGLLVDLVADRPPRPGLLSTVAARELEERLAAHLPHAGVASRGQVCRLTLPPDGEDDGDGIGAIAGAFAVARGSVGVLRLPPPRLHAILDDGRVRPAAAMLCADLVRDRALTALAARALSERGVRVGVLKRPIGRVASRRALAGILPAGAAGGLPPRLLARLLGDA